MFNVFNICSLQLSFYIWFQAGWLQNATQSVWICFRIIWNYFQYFCFYFQILLSIKIKALIEKQKLILLCPLKHTKPAPSWLQQQGWETNVSSVQELLGLLKVQISHNLNLPSRHHCQERNNSSMQWRLELERSRTFFLTRSIWCMNAKFVSLYSDP